MAPHKDATPASTPHPPHSSDGLNSQALAARTAAVLDLPPRTARLLLVAGLAGVILIAVQSLLGNRTETIAVDKLLHFGGYAVLAAVFVLALRPRYAVPALLLLAGLSYAIELLQPLNSRTFGLDDALANTLGIAVGAAVGLGARLVFGYLRTELQAAAIRRELVSVPTGTTIVHAGERIDKFWIIARGQVGLYHDDAGDRAELHQLGPGEMFGLLEEIEGRPQLLTVVALSEVQLYRLDYDTLLDAVGGPQQPLGVIVRYLAGQLREAGTRMVALERRLDGRDA